MNQNPIEKIINSLDLKPIILHMISENGDHSEYIIGNDIACGHIPQLVAPGR